MFLETGRLSKLVSDYDTFAAAPAQRSLRFVWAVVLKQAADGRGYFAQFLRSSESAPAFGPVCDWKEAADAARLQRAQRLQMLLQSLLRLCTDVVNFVYY